MVSDDQAIPFAPVRLKSGTLARDAWSLAPELVHLNHGSFGAVPNEVTEYQRSLHRHADRSPVGWFPRIAEYVAHARELAAPFVGAAADDTVFVPNASAAATVVFNSLRLDVGDEILVTNHGYGAVSMGADRLARRFGAVVRTVPIGISDPAKTVVERFVAAMTRNTRLIVVDQITSSTARAFPTREITTAAHDRGIRVLVDGAHGPGLVRDAAIEGGGDWWFGNMHKWPCAPRGSALLVTKAEDRDDLWPLIDSWGGQDPYPDRFDAQGTYDATAYIATPRAIEFIEREYGWEATRRRLSENADAAARAIAQALEPYSDEDPLVDVGMPAVAMRLIRLPLGLGKSREQADAFRMQVLDEVGIETAFTSFDGEGYYRLSMHLYNDFRDVELFINRGVPLILSAAGMPHRHPSTII